MRFQMDARMTAFEPLGAAGRRIVPGAAGGLAALALAILLARETDAPFLGTILTDASSSVLSSAPRAACTCTGSRPASEAPM